MHYLIRLSLFLPLGINAWMPENVSCCRLQPRSDTAGMHHVEGHDNLADDKIEHLGSGLKLILERGTGNKLNFVDNGCSRYKRCRRIRRT